jgi:hypothetical protein
MRKLSALGTPSQIDFVNGGQAVLRTSSNKHRSGARRFGQAIHQLGVPGSTASICRRRNSVVERADGCSNSHGSKLTIATHQLSGTEGTASLCSRFKRQRLYSSQVYVASLNMSADNSTDHLLGHVKLSPTPDFTPHPGPDGTSANIH